MKQVSVSVSDSDIIILDLLWEKGDMTASNLYKILMEQVGWSKSTTYTVLKRAIDKGLVERLGEDYTCRANISREEVQKNDVKNVFARLFTKTSDDFVPTFMSTYISEHGLSKEDEEYLKDLVEKLK